MQRLLPLAKANVFILVWVFNWAHPVRRIGFLRSK
jgi:hypothetical protein